MLEKLFNCSEANTTIRTELLAGLTTFLTMSYIIFVQPAVLSGQMFGMQTGMDFGAVMTATCVAAAVATLIMGCYARYPIAQAPGMGENFFFVFTVLMAAEQAGFDHPWQVALGVVFISGVLFLLITLTGAREVLFNAISPSLKNGIAVGIGIFIAFIGLQNAGLIQANQGTLVTLNTHFGQPELLVFFFGLLITAVLQTRRIKGAILWGILASTLFTVLLKHAINYLPETLAAHPFIAESSLMLNFRVADSVVKAPPSIAPTFFKMDIWNALSGSMLPFIIVFLIMDIFDTLGTLVGVSEQAGFIQDNTLPRANQAMLSDAVGTVVGACLGTSTVTSYIESASGVEAGGRTGLTSVTVAVLFLLALFFSPLIAMVATYPPITAPALVVVGAMMIRNVSKIAWTDASECIPAFMIMIGIAFTYSISDGLALGFIAYPLIKLLSGRGRDVHWLMYVLVFVFVANFVLFR